MVVELNRAQPLAPQRRNAGRQGVVEVVVLRLARTEHAHSRRQRRRDIDDVFARGHQLLSQQVAQTARRLDRPSPLREQCRRLQQDHALPFRGPDPELGEPGLVASIATAVWDPW
jgi:hypothetical protein